MPKCDKLLQKARNNPAGLRFTELVQLAECYGFEFDRQKGSHHIYAQPVFNRQLVLVPDKNGKAKPYQVKQALKEIAAITDEE
jgi:predicted RNA binding protein YcfA (HicA-like mRNA interferase family)